MECSVESGSSLIDVFLHDRDASSDSKGEGACFESGGGLFAFVFVEVNEPHDSVDDLGLVARCGDFGAGAAFFDVELKDAVEDGIRRQGIGIGLVGAEFGGGGLLNGIEGDHLVLGIEVAGEGVHLHLREVGNHRETTAHIAVEGAVTNRDFALVASGEQEGAVFIGERHEQETSGAGLQVFLGDVGG